MHNAYIMNNLMAFDFQMTPQSNLHTSESVAHKVHENEAYEIDSGASRMPVSVY